MSRKILFKGKVKENNQWVEGGFYISSSGDLIIVENIEYSPCFDEPCGGVTTILHNVYYDTVCQYIGTKDKNLKPVFEKDKVQVIRNTGGSFIGTIVYLNEKAKFMIKSFDSNNYFEIDCGEIEVIGNICDIKSS